MEQSILKSTKKLLGIGDDDASFDLDITTHINAAFAHLRQLGVGPKAGFSIDDDTTEWADFLPAPDPVPDNYLPILNAAKTNLILQVRLNFDPPDSWHVLNSLQNQITQSDSQLNILREETDWVDPDPYPSKEQELDELIQLVDSQVIDR